MDLFKIVLSLLFLFHLGLCRTQSEVLTVDVHSAKDLIRSSHRYLDVRTEEEFKKGHLENALNVPYCFFTPEGTVKNPKFLEQVAAVCNKDDFIVVQPRLMTDNGKFLKGCKSGVRSLQASVDLLAADYKNVKNMGGGYAAWVDNGFTVKKPNDEF
ncbi:hypothetical protein QJS10_CPB15g00450 [Acorus calamus]|uniref:Rhodanese domain-containing protein n=1 Tax=Acorus calamus TaxID=4465 RepID=A0AAV9D459_ACOCL|nr:hypothetical protein QJS10_CPB15g00450 [Acorus calamus]